MNTVQKKKKVKTFLKKNKKEIRRLVLSVIKIYSLYRH